MTLLGLFDGPSIFCLILALGAWSYLIFVLVRANGQILLDNDE